VSAGGGTAVGQRPGPRAVTDGVIRGAVPVSEPNLAGGRGPTDGCISHVHKRFWNQGIATEAASLVCWAAATRWRLSRLVALVHPDHLGSRRVAENVGMRAERTTVLEDDYPAIVYIAQLGGGPAVEPVPAPKPVGTAPRTAVPAVRR